MATNESIKEFIKKLGALAVNECNRRISLGLGFVLPSVCIAQSAHETGWGDSTLMTKANAFFGIKAGGSWTGKVFRADTWEMADGEAYNTTANFRAYDSLEDSVKDYYSLIVDNPRYINGVSIYPDNIKSAYDTLNAIWAGGYATDEDYVTNVYSLLNGRNLTQWDAKIDGVTVIDPENMGDYIYLDAVDIIENPLYKFYKITPMFTPKYLATPTPPDGPGGAEDI